MPTFAANVIAYNKSLRFTGRLPDGIGIMNPFRENAFALPASTAFYRKYYNDQLARHLILGINPGRFGAGLTGIPFTDPKRLKECCEIVFGGPITHEPSSVFIYDMIRAFGGEELFYRKFYINSVFPLGFTKPGKNGKEINYNYYDSKALTEAIFDSVTRHIKRQISFGIHTDACICLGTGKNYAFLESLNKQEHFFERIIPLEHPRFIMQYRVKRKQEFIRKYIRTLKGL